MMHMHYDYQEFSFLIDLFIEAYILSHLIMHPQLTSLSLNVLQIYRMTQQKSLLRSMYPI